MSTAQDAVLSRGVPLPLQLRTAPHQTLEEYVQARFQQFIPPFASRIAPELGAEDVQEAARDVLKALPAPDYTAGIDTRNLQLVFRHDCQNLGCLDLQCVLCEHNPLRRCSINFAAKYLVNDVMRAKCDAPIRVEVVDSTTEQPVVDNFPPGMALELSVLNGHLYDSRCADRAGEELSDELDACELLNNNKAAALLAAGASGKLTKDNRVVVPLVRGSAVLPDIHVTDSSEAMLSGRKPPFRLLARAVVVHGEDGEEQEEGGGQGSPSGSAANVPMIASAVSEGFVVATRRTRTAGKVDIPNVDDHVAKLDHMGKETVKKLSDIRGSAAAAGIEVQVPDNCVQRVGEFRKLALLAEADGHLRQKLQQLLKLSKEKWDEARDHAMRAVVADNRMRIWYTNKSTMDLGLLFSCRLGTVDVERPVGLLRKASDARQTTMEATLMAQQTPAQREQVRELQPVAAAAWWEHGHPGWAIYPVDSDQFMATGSLDADILPTTNDLELPAAAAAGAPAAAAAFPPGLASAFVCAPPPLGVLPSPQLNEALLRAIVGAGQFGSMLVGTPMVLPSNPAPVQASPFAEQRQSAHGQQAAPTAVTMAADGLPLMPPPPPPPSQQPQRQFFSNVTTNQTNHHQQQQNGSEEGPPASVFASNAAAAAAPAAKASLDVSPSLTLGSLTAMLGSDFKLPGFNLQNFPSVPGGGTLPGSADLEALLAQHIGGSSGGGGNGSSDPTAAAGSQRFSSMLFSKSMEMPEGAGEADAVQKGDAAANGKGDAQQQEQSGPESMETEDMDTKEENGQGGVESSPVQKSRRPQRLSGNKRK